MAVVEKIYRSENSLEEVNRTRACHLNRSSGAQSFDMSSRTDVIECANIYSPEKKNPVLSSAYSHRNGFSKSMVDLSSRNGFRKSVMFEEDLFAHKEMLQRARNRFKELELKYPEIFQNSTRTSSLSSTGSNQRSRSLDRSESLEPKSVEHQEIQTSKTDTLQVLRSATNDSDVVTLSRKRPPPLSVAMKLHNLEDSCDSAFDEIDRESVHSKTSHEPTPTSFHSNSHFLYLGESVESDKDSGISTDRPCTPNSRSSRPLRWVDPRLSGTQSLPLKSKSLTALLSETTSQELLTGSDSDSHKSRSKDRRGILKSVAYRKQEIQSESLDIPTTSNSSTCSQQRKNRSGSLPGNIRRGKFWSIPYC